MLISMTTIKNMTSPICRNVTIELHRKQCKFFSVKLHITIQYDGENAAQTSLPAESCVYVMLCGPIGCDRDVI